MFVAPVGSRTQGFGSPPGRHRRTVRVTVVRTRMGIDPDGVRTRTVRVVVVRRVVVIAYRLASGRAGTAPSLRRSLTLCSYGRPATPSMRHSLPLDWSFLKPPS